MRSNGEPLEWPPHVLSHRHALRVVDRGLPATCLTRALPQFVSCRILARKVFFELPPLTSLDSSGEGLSTTDAADPSVLTDPSTVKTNLIPERIEKTYSVSSQMMTSTNSGPETVVFPMWLEVG